MIFRNFEISRAAYYFQYFSLTHSTAINEKDWVSQRKMAFGFRTNNYRQFYGMHSIDDDATTTVESIPMHVSSSGCSLLAKNARRSSLSKACWLLDGHGFQLSYTSDL